MNLETGHVSLSSPIHLSEKLNPHASTSSLYLSQFGLSPCSCSPIRSFSCFSVPLTHDSHLPLSGISVGILRTACFAVEAAKKVGMCISLSQNRKVADAQVHGKSQSSPHIPCVLLGVIRQDHHCLLVACPSFGKLQFRRARTGAVGTHPVPGQGQKLPNWIIRSRDNLLLLPRGTKCLRCMKFNVNCAFISERDLLQSVRIIVWV